MAARLNIQRTGDGGVEQLQLKPGNNKLRVVPGRTFNLQDPDGQPIDPSQLRVLQVDNDLIIENIPVEGSTETASVTLEGYYQVCSATDRCTVSVGGEDAAVAQGAEGQENLGTTENSQTTVLADVSTKPLGALSDGTFVLYDTGFQAPEQPATEEFPIRPVLYGAGGLAVVALAAGGGGGGGDPSGAPNLGDVPLALKSATSFNNRFPTISGTAKPGTVVTLRLDTDNDQRENVTYSATADANGNWSVNLQSAKPATGNLPATGLSDSNTLEVSGALDGVQGAALPVVTLTYDNTPPASAEIAAVSGDNIITAAEKTAGVAVSGTAEANGTVELKIGGTTKLVAVDAEGKWNTTLSAAELPAADGQHTLTATAIDAAGNRGPAATSSVTLHTNSKAPVIGIIASDDIINAAEAAAGVKLQGSAEAGSKVELTFGTNKVAATADANGHWEVTAPATGIADGKYTLTAAVTSPAGGTASATRAFTVDKTAPAKATNIKLDGGDNVITAAEARDGVHFTGNAEAGSKVSVTWNGHTHTGTVGSNGSWDVQFVPSELPKPAAGATASSTYQVTVTDAAGNTSGADSHAVTVQGAPAPTIAPSPSAPAPATPAPAAPTTPAQPPASPSPAPATPTNPDTNTGDTSAPPATNPSPAPAPANPGAGDTTAPAPANPSPAPAPSTPANPGTGDTTTPAPANPSPTAPPAANPAPTTPPTADTPDPATPPAATPPAASPSAPPATPGATGANDTVTPTDGTTTGATAGAAAPAADAATDATNSSTTTTTTTTTSPPAAPAATPAGSPAAGAAASSSAPTRSLATKSLTDTDDSTDTSSTSQKSLTLDDLTSSSAEESLSSAPAAAPTPTAPPPAPVSTTATVDSLVGTQPWDHHPTV
ncbi:Ig-like domain-containing protein [Lautropia mirabilis]